MTNGRIGCLLLVVATLAGCGGADESADVEVAVREQYPNRAVSCAKSDVTYGDGNAYSCSVGRKPFCFARVGDELLELWDERPLRPGEPGYIGSTVATIRTGPSC